jgi:hypothetical protein
MEFQYEGTGASYQRTYCPHNFLGSLYMYMNIEHQQN